MSSHGPITPTMSAQRPRLAGEPGSQQASGWQLDHLPDDVVRHVALLMPDPAALATSCRRTAAVLSQDTFLLDWAREHQPASTLSTEHRHPGYVLLQWRRMHRLSLRRLTALLLRHCSSTAARPSADRSTAASGPSSTQRIHAAMHLLDAGNALGAVQALLPHSQQLLLLYASQAGHMPLLRELLAAHTELIPARLQWDDLTYVDCNMLASAAHAAAKAGQVKALHAVLAAMGPISSSFLEQLLRSAVDGKAATTVTALLQRCQESTSSSGLLSPLAHLCCRLLPDAAETGSYPVVAQLAAHAPKGKPAWGGAGAYGQLVEQYRSAYSAALRRGHVHLLPLLKGSMSRTEVAVRVCEAASEAVSAAAAANLVPLLPQAICEVGPQPAAQLCGLWNSAMQAALESESRAVLHDIWIAASASELGAAVLSAVTRQDVECQGGLDTLGKCVLSRLAEMVPLPSDAVVQWVLRHALPSVDKRDLVDTITQTALAALRHGHLQLAARLLAPDFAVEQLVAGSEEWRRAERRARLLDAVERGDAEALQAQLQQLGPQAVSEWLGAGTPSSRNLQADIKRRMAGISDEAAAEAVARVMAQHLDGTEGSLVDLVVSHSGRLLPILCERSHTLRQMLAGPDSDERYCNAALASGQLDVAEWLIGHEQQCPTYLSAAAADAFAHVTMPPPPAPPLQVLEQQQWVRHEQYRRVGDLVGNWVQLLHRLANKQWDREAASIVGSYGGGFVIGDGRCERWPAGARVILEPCLQLVLGTHNPDLLHALLVFRDAWHGISDGGSDEDV